MKRRRRGGQRPARHPCLGGVDSRANQRGGPLVVSGPCDPELRVIAYVGRGMKKPDFPPRDLGPPRRINLKLACTRSNINNWNRARFRIAKCVPRPQLLQDFLGEGSITGKIGVLRIVKELIAHDAVAAPAFEHLGPVNQERNGVPSSQVAVHLTQ